MPGWSSSRLVWCRGLTATVAAQRAMSPHPISSSALPAAATLRGRITSWRTGHDQSYFHQFAITSDYGKLEAVGRSQLAVRLSEIQALAALEEVRRRRSSSSQPRRGRERREDRRRRRDRPVETARASAGASSASG